jgi:hypothetical protein
VICLGNPKLNGGSITEIGEAKTTLTLVYEITLTGSVPVGQGPSCNYRGTDKFLARPGRKKATATEDFGVLISYL